MLTTVILELTLELDFSHAPGSSASWGDPGQPATVDIDAVFLGAQRIPLTCFTADELEAMQEAAFEQAYDFCPVLDRD